MGNLRIDPFRGFEHIARKMNDFVGEFEKGVNVEYGGFSPRVDIFEDDDHLLVSVELPGVIKEDVKVTVSDENVLMIKGMKKRQEKANEGEEEMTYIRAERTYGEFMRSFMLPENIDRGSVAAKYDNGILEIQLTKKEPEKPKEVEVKIG
jgi:HSP20 family protein